MIKKREIEFIYKCKEGNKKLQYGQDKYFTMRIRKKQEDFKDIAMFVDGWKLDEVDNIDIFEGNMEISHINSEKYLGQILSSDSRNTLNITKMRNKSIEIKNKIIEMLNIMSVGINHFKVVII